MKTYTLKFRASDYQDFLAIREGRKIYETRAATKRYQDISVGDKIIIKCGQDIIEGNVKEVIYVPSIAALLKKIPLKKIMPNAKTETEARKQWYAFPGYKEKIQKHGLVAFRIK